MPCNNYFEAKEVWNGSDYGTSKQRRIITWGIKCGKCDNGANVIIVHKFNTKLIISAAIYITTS